MQQGSEFSAFSFYADPRWLIQLLFSFLHVANEQYSNETEHNNPSDGHDNVEHDNPLYLWSLT